MEKKTILICDDDLGIIDVASIVLEDAGFNVITITNSENVLQKILEHQPDLILMDLWMPHLSGEEVTKRIKSDPNTQHIPVIIVSANKDTEVIAQAAGADSFIAKPFDIDELEKTVQQYMM